MEYLLQVYLNKKHIQEVLRLTNVDAIKNAIMNHGAVQTSFYWNSLYYNVTDHSYYCPRPGSNHAVAIVGWDDNFTSPEFPEKGAYIIKNSWGDGWGEEGYFYLSYYDANAGDEATIFIAEKTDNYDNLYQYDPLGWTSSFGYGTTTWGANVFTAEADEALKAVSFYTTSNDIQYIVYIYLNPVHGSPINSSGPVAVKSGKFPEAGYHTVPLDAGVLLVPNKDFSVVVKFTTPGYTNPLAIETPIYLYSTKATADSGQSYVSKDGTEWSDLKSLYDNTNACIKAFTSASISTVDASEEADYISIQAAINNSSEGSTIFVYPGTYYENVDVDRQLDIISIGGGAVTDVIAASSNDHVFEIKADGVTISGFNISGASTSSSAGICLHGSGKTLLSNNIVSDNSCGIYLQSSDNNVIYNNHFNNLVNVYSSGTSTGSVWNITKTAGRNIAGGPYLGGNFWHRPDGTGFSQVAEDADGDGICDSAYALLPDNIDTLPLATPDQKYPVINSITLNNSTPCRGDLIFVTVNATDNRGVQSVNANDISLEFQGDNIWIGTITALKGKHSVNVAVMDATTNVAWDNTTTYTATTIPIIVDASGGADYTTIQNAVNASVAEDLIIVYPGIYSENVVIDRQLDIISTGGAALTSVTAASATKHVFEITADRVTIDGFSVSGATGSLRAGIYLSSSYDSMLINNIVSGNSYGIYLSSSGNGTLVNNTVSCNGLNGIYLVSSHNNTLADNAVSDNEWNGLFLISSSNITLVNNAVSNNAWDGIYMVSLINSTLKNNTISNNNGNGISLSFSSNNNSMTNNSVSKNAAHGIRLFSSSDNLIYNNLFNNSVNTHVDVECNDNVWNITKIAGINIAGGPYLGGNCWTKPEGSGFSQTHFDNDKDGICESVHALNDNNIDYLPLVLPDWNLWNNLDSEGHDPEGNLDGRYISINEVIDAYNAFTNEYAPAGSIITIDNVIDLYSAFCNVTPM